MAPVIIAALVILATALWIAVDSFVTKRKLSRGLSTEHIVAEQVAKERETKLLRKVEGEVSKKLDELERVKTKSGQFLVDALRRECAEVARQEASKGMKPGSDTQVIMNFIQKAEEVQTLARQQQKGLA